MGNQGHPPKALGSQSLSLHNQYKITRTDLISARSSRPLSNIDEYHDIWPCTILVHSYGNLDGNLDNRQNDNGQMPVLVALTDGFMENQGHLPEA
jgi:hypothetical protein